MKVKFTKLAALLLAGVALLAAGCTDYEVDIQNVDKKVNDLAVKTAADLNAQVDALKAMIATLETNYKAADDALKAEIQQKIDAINTQISDLQNLKLDKSTFETYKTETAETLRLLNEAVQSIKENYATKDELTTAIAGVEAKLNDYVLKTTFQEFVDIAATDAELAALKTDLEGQIATAKSELEAAYKAADEALEKKIQGKIDGLDTRLKKVEADIESLGIQLGKLNTTVNGILDELKFAEGDLQGYIDDAAAEALAAAKKYVDDEIAKIRTELLALRETVGTLQERIQSIVFVPDYDDLKITTNLLYLSQTVEGEDGETEEMVSVIDQPFKVTYEILPAQYAVAVAYFADEILQFDVKPVATRADDDAAAAPAIDFMKNADGEIIFEYDEATVEKTGLITFTVMPKNIASAAYAANGLKPDYHVGFYPYVNVWKFLDGEDQNLGRMDVDELQDAIAEIEEYYDEYVELYGKEFIDEYLAELKAGVGHYTVGVWEYSDLLAFEARAAFAASLHMKMLEGYNVDYPGYYFQEFNEVASTYNVLYPNKTAEIEILPDPYKPDLDEDGKPKTDPDGNVKLVKATPEYQYLPYSSLRSNPVGEKPSQDPKGYRIILDQAVPGFEVTVGDEVKILTAEDAARNGFVVPGVKTSFDEFTYDQNGAKILDEENFIETAKVYAEIEMNPEKTAAERKLAIGNIITGNYFFESFLGKTPFFGQVEITPALGEVDVKTEIVWTYEFDANVDHNLFYENEQVEGGTIYNRQDYAVTIDTEDLDYLEKNLDITLESFAGKTPSKYTITYVGEDGKEVDVTDQVVIEDVTITEDGKLTIDISNFEWDKVYTVVADYELEAATITVNGTITTVDRNREKVVLGPLEHTFIVNGDEFNGTYYVWASEPQHAAIFEAFDKEGVINVKGETIQNGDFEYDAEQEEFNAAELEGKLRMADPSGSAKGYIDFNRDEIVLNSLSTFTPEVLAGDLFNSGKTEYEKFKEEGKDPNDGDPNLWLGNVVTRNVTTFIGEEVEITMIFNYKVPDYNFLHLSFYTFNTDPSQAYMGTTMVPFIQYYDLPAEIKGVPCKVEGKEVDYETPLWWTQVNPSYFTTEKGENDTEADAQTRVSNRYALADYDVAYINLAELAFNVVDDQDEILEQEELEALGLAPKFIYTDDTLDDKNIPDPDKKACNNEFLLYKSLWVDNTTFYYLTNELPYIPALGTLTLNVGTVGQGGYAFPVATRFQYTKNSVKYPEVELNYSKYAMVRWTPFQEPKAEGFTMVLDENKIYVESLFKGMELMDNRPNNTHFYVIKDGEWVVGDAVETATKDSKSNGYITDVNAKKAYHIEDTFDISKVELPVELQRLLTIKYSEDGGETLYDEQNEEQTRTPYVVFDYRSEVQFRGTIDIPVVVKLDNPWQQPIIFSYVFTIKGTQE